MNNNIENKNWDEIVESFKKSQDYKDCMAAYLYSVFIRWLICLKKYFDNDK